MRLLYYILLSIGVALPLNVSAQNNTRPYGMLFNGQPQINVQAAQAQQSFNKLLPSYPQTSADKLSQSNTLPNPTLVIPSAEPATFEGHEAEAARIIQEETKRIEEARKAQEEAEKAKANAPTVIVVQQPPPEVTLWNAITAVPALVVKNLLR